MTPTFYKNLFVNLILCALFICGAVSINAQTSAFTYQGRLNDNSTAANGSYDMQFRVYDTVSGGTQKGITVTKTAVAVTNGVFTVSIDPTLTAFFNQAGNYLEISVRLNGGSSYTTLAPRQLITSAPYSVQSISSQNADSLAGFPAANYLQTNGSGANLTNLNAANISSGTLGDARLSANVAFRNQANTFTGDQTITGNLSQSGAAMLLNLTNGFAVSGTVNSGSIPATGAGVRMMFYSSKAAFRAGSVNGTQWDNANVGYYSFAAGYNTMALNYSTATGAGTKATGVWSTAMGSDTTASGTYSTALGNNTTASGDISIATGAQTTASGNSSTATGFYTTASGDYSTAMGYGASTNNRKGSFVYGDNTTVNLVSAAADNQFVVRAQNIWLGQNNGVTATTGRFLETSTGAYLSTGGTWTNSSSVKLKTNFAPVNSRLVLQKVLALPMTTWNYKAEDAGVVHLGAMAQDFRRAFNLGADDEHISTVDADGVALAAIQGLNAEFEERTTKLQNENNTQQKTIERQNEQLQNQQRQIDALKQIVCAANPNTAVCRAKK